MAYTPFAAGRTNPAEGHLSILKRMPAVGIPPLSGQVLRIRRQPGHYVDLNEPVVDIHVGGDLVTLLAPEAGKVLTCLRLWDRVNPGDPVFEITGVGTPTYELFIAYRQEDSAGHAGRLGDNLVKDFGRGQVFKDVESLSIGEDFVDVVRDRLRRASAMVVVIGPHWLTLQSGGRQRLHQLDDLHREEIRTALERRIPIFPALVNGARMPSANDLPTDIRALSTKYAAEVRDRNWESDVARLSSDLARALSQSPRRQAFLAQIEVHDPRLRTGPKAQWVTDDPFRSDGLIPDFSPRAGRSLTLDWAAHSNGITLRGRSEASEILRAVRCTVVAVERWVTDLNQFVKDPAHYPADVFPPLLLTGQRDLGHDDSVDFGFIHLADSRLDLVGQTERVTMSKAGIWKLTCLIEHSQGSLGTYSLCFAWEGGGKAPVGSKDCPGEP